MLEVLTDSEEIRGDVVVKKEVRDFRCGFLGGVLAVVLQTGTETYFGVKELTGREGFVLFNQFKDVVRKSVVASPWDIGKVFYL